MGLVSLLFGFKGRINRAQFWLGNLGAGFAGISLMLLLGVMFIPVEEVPKTGQGVLRMISVMGAVLGPPLFMMAWIGLALQVKRFHDRGRSGWWTLLPMLPATMITMEVFTALASGKGLEEAVASVFVWALVAQAINLFVFVDLGCMPSKEGPNKYDSPPGGGFSGGAPITGAPGQPGANKAAPAIPGMGQAHALVGAESAIDRAIAERAKQAQASARASAPAPSVGLRPAATGSFGRKVTQ